MYNLDLIFGNSYSKEYGDEEKAVVGKCNSLNICESLRMLETAQIYLISIVVLIIITFHL